MLATTQGMRQRGAYVAIETRFVNPHSQEISVEILIVTMKPDRVPWARFTSGLLPLAGNRRPKI